jgi:hypothetical protein
MTVLFHKESKFHICSFHWSLNWAFAEGTRGCFVNEAVIRWGGPRQQLSWGPWCCRFFEGLRPDGLQHITHKRI